MDRGQLDRVLTNAGFVRQLARALSRDDHEADDVAQDTLAMAVEPRLAVEGKAQIDLALRVAVPRAGAVHAHRVDAEAARTLAGPFR